MFVDSYVQNFSYLHNLFYLLYINISGVQIMSEGRRIDCTPP